MVIGLRIGGKAVPFRISKLERSSEPTPSENISWGEIGPSTELLIKPWLKRVPGCHFSVEAVQGPLTSMNLFLTESYDASEMLSFIGVAPPLGLLLSGVSGSGKKQLLSHFLITNRLEGVPFSALTLLRDPDAPRRRLDGNVLPEMVQELLRITGQSGEKCVLVLQDLDSLARLASEHTDLAIKKITEALATISTTSKLRYLGITSDSTKLPAGLRRLFHRETSIPLPEQPQRQSVLAVHLSGLAIQSPQETDWAQRLSKVSFFQQFRVV